MRRLLFLLAALVAATGGAVAAPQFEFLAAPQINLSLVYRLDKLTGDVIACQYAHNPGKTDIEPGAFGITVCYRSGDGATKQEPGDYGLVATRHEQEGGVFRVDYRSGALRIAISISSARSRATATSSPTSTSSARRPTSERSAGRSGAIGQPRNVRSERNDSVRVERLDRIIAALDVVDRHRFANPVSRRERAASKPAAPGNRRCAGGCI